MAASPARELDVHTLFCRRESRKRQGDKEGRGGIYNRAPIIWYSKRQNTVEASTFGSEFQAIKNAVELTESLRYKLGMFGIPIDNATNVFCDNEAVYKDTTMPESTLKRSIIQLLTTGAVRLSQRGR